jgi:hypothetical protein
MTCWPRERRIARKRKLADAGPADYKDCGEGRRMPPVKYTCRKCKTVVTFTPEEQLVFYERKRQPPMTIVHTCPKCGEKNTVKVPRS